MLGCNFSWNPRILDPPVRIRIGIDNQVSSPSAPTATSAYLDRKQRTVTGLQYFYFTHFQQPTHGHSSCREEKDKSSEPEECVLRKTADARREKTVPTRLLLVHTVLTRLLL
jgi:hypothetical protein